jgi:hypothetical protein
MITPISGDKKPHELCSSEKAEDWIDNVVNFNEINPGVRIQVSTENDENLFPCIGTLSPGQPINLVLSF